MTKLTAIILFFTALASGPAAANDSPEAVVESLHATLLGAMREADTLGFSGRNERIAPTLNDSFDFETIARIVTGRGWKAASDEQKSQFVAVFRQLSASTYASNFSGYSGEKFETVGSEDTRGARIVRTHLVKTDGEKISLNYLLRQTDDQWRIVNVIAQGVSDLSLKRAEYTAVIKSEGFDALVNRLNSKVRQFNQ